jgi:hypothetical protein
MIVEEDALKKAVEEYLGSRPYIMWGDYDLTKKDRKALAEEWLVGQVVCVLDRMPDEAFIPAGEVLGDE